MKKLVIGALAATAAFAATPALASSIHIGFYSPAPVVYHRPAPVVYHQPYYSYYTPAPYYVKHGHRHGHGHNKHYARWGQPRHYSWR